MDTKLVGDIAVSSFILKSLRLGFRISLPFGDRFKYDLIVDVNNHLYRVQVKKAYKNKDSYTIKVLKSNTNRKEVKYTKYEADDFDFLAMYLEDLDIFYIVPCSVYVSKNWTFTVTPQASSSLMNVYKEAWALFL